MGALGLFKSPRCEVRDFLDPKTRDPIPETRGRQAAYLPMQKVAKIRSRISSVTV